MVIFGILNVNWGSQGNTEKAGYPQQLLHIYTSNQFRVLYMEQLLKKHNQHLKQHFIINVHF